MQRSVTGVSSSARINAGTASGPTSMISPSFRALRVFAKLVRLLKVIQLFQEPADAGVWPDSCWWLPGLSEFGGALRGLTGGRSGGDRGTASREYCDGTSDKHAGTDHMISP